MILLKIGSFKNFVTLAIPEFKQTSVLRILETSSVEKTVLRNISNSVLKPFPETGVGQTQNATHMVQMQNLKKELMFITDGNGFHHSGMTYK